MHTREEKLKAFGRMLDVVDTLREKCPWDRKQTNESLRPNTIEEVFELADAISKSDTHNICKELGDVLLHICFYSRIGSETGDFDIADVCNALVDKLIFRHPHVYHPSQIGAPDPKPLPYGEEKAENADGEEVKTAQQVIQNWEQLKLKEKDGNKTVLSGVPNALPSLIKAYRIQDKARNVGFDWEDKGDVWAKVREELGELETELRNEDRNRSEAELGDFIFSVVNAARLYKLNPDNALERTNQKFTHRFNYIEAKAKAAGRNIKDLTRKNVNVLGFENIDYEGNSEQAVREDLINNGVLFGRYTEDLGYFINKGINTIQNQNNRSILETDNRSHEISIVRIKQQMKKEIKVSANRTFPGTNRLHPSITDVQDFIRKYLNSKVGTYLTGWDAKSLTVRLQQDAWYCSAIAFVNAPINNFFLDLSFALDDSISV